MSAYPNNDDPPEEHRKISDLKRDESCVPAEESLESTGHQSCLDTDAPSSAAIANLIRHDADSEKVPKQLKKGRFIIERILGKGGFGVVCLARDTAIRRQVAIKLPSQRFFKFGNSVAQFIEEAQKTATLKHAGIVTIYDVGHEDGVPYIVMEYIDGLQLRAWAKCQLLDHRCLTAILVKIAEAVGVAHQAGLYHRDLKPGNILVDRGGVPHVADFGLAIYEQSRLGKKGEISGTEAYMSPEQVRGETHRIDGRSDIWALGVIFYELLAGKRPFNATTRDALFREITTTTPRPLRQVDSRIPLELGRICGKCLEARMADRYTSCADFIDDLQHWLDKDQRAEQTRESAQAVPAMQPPGTAVSMPPKIVPKGLRSFDEHDADFFLELLPGPRDRDGYPESIRFWKQRIEQTDADKTFSVGLIYGPSGCGKSSLVRAGILPTLSRHVDIVYLETSANDNERRLLRMIKTRRPAAADAMTLCSALSFIRDRPRPNSKLLLVLDQFEQWLHRHELAGEHELVSALRHCDGTNIQCVLLVRDDFWLGISRFMQLLEVPLLEGHNSAMVDLFDLDHSEKVLMAIGHAYDKVPPPDVELSDHQRRFLKRALNNLSHDGKVIPVRLSLFAEMMKGKPWTVSSLASTHAIDEIEVRFLEEQFCAQTSSPEHKRQLNSARAVLDLLLPEIGSSIRGGRRSEQELRSKATSADRHIDFDALMRTLNTELKLISLVEPDKHYEGSLCEQTIDEVSSAVDSSVGPPVADSISAPCYQLTHDFLIPSIRRWLWKKETETYTGRARLRLIEHTAICEGNSVRRHCPPLWDFLTITLFTRVHDWTSFQKRMMYRAASYHATIIGALGVLLFLSFWDGPERIMATRKVNSLRTANEVDVRESLAELRPYLPWASPDLYDLLGADATASDALVQEIRVRLALMSTDGTQIGPLGALLTSSPPPYPEIIKLELGRISGPLWREFHADGIRSDRRLRAGLALAAVESDSDQWTVGDFQFIADEVAQSNPEDLVSRCALVKPISQKCIPHWERLLKDPDVSKATKLRIGRVIVTCVGADQPRIRRLLRDIAPENQAKLVPYVAEVNSVTQ